LPPRNAAAATILTAQRITFETVYWWGIGMATRDEVWEAVCTLPELDPEALGHTVIIGTLRRVYESWSTDAEKCFSIYRVSAGVVALVAVPETASFRLHFAPNGYPAAAKVLSLVGDNDDTPIQPAQIREWDSALSDAT
jgi:hypothetical protein